jgi:hypothetical protein
VSALRTALRPEDGVLAGWLAIVAPGLSAVTSPDVTEGPLAGLAIVIATLLVIICLATRPPDQPGVRISDEGDHAPRWIIAGPLVGAVALVSATGFDHLGINGFDLGAIVFVAAGVAIVANRWLPVIASEWRRLLVLPFTLVAGSFFADFSANVLDALRPSDLANMTSQTDAGFAAFVLVMLVGGLATFYAMLVVAPRELADPEDAGFRWVTRFGLFLLASVVGIGWLSLLA